MLKTLSVANPRGYKAWVLQTLGVASRRCCKPWVLQTLQTRDSFLLPLRHIDFRLQKIAFSTRPRSPAYRLGLDARLGAASAVSRYLGVSMHAASSALRAGEQCAPSSSFRLTLSTLTRKVLFSTLTWFKIGFPRLYF